MKPFYLNLNHAPGDATSAPGGGGSAAATPTTPSTPASNDAANIFGGTSDSVEPATPAGAGDAASRLAPSQQSGASPTPGTVPAEGRPAPPLTLAQQQTPPPATLTPEQLAQLATSAAQQAVARMPQHQTQRTQEAQSQLTQAQFEEAFRVPKMDAARFQAITGYAADKPDQITAMHAWGQDLVREALAMGNYQLEQARASVESRLNPLITAQQQTQESAMDNEFWTTNSHLKPVEGLVRQATISLKNEGARFSNKQDMFNAVVQRAQQLLGPLAQHLTQLSPNGVAQTAQQQPAAVFNAPGRQPPNLGGGNQLLGNRQAATANNDAKTIFG